MNLFRRKNIDDMVTSAPGPLRKVMGATDLVMMGLAAMVGTGIFVVLGRAALSAGPGISLSFLVRSAVRGRSKISGVERELTTVKEMPNVTYCVILLLQSTGRIVHLFYRENRVPSV